MAPSLPGKREGDAFLSHSLRQCAGQSRAASLPFASEETWTTGLFALAYPLSERSQDFHCGTNRHGITPGDFIFVTSNGFSARFGDATITSCYFM